MIVLLFLLVVPMAEIAVFIQVGSRIGVGTMLLLVVASAVVGIRLIHAQGFATASRVQAMIARGESPALGMLEGLALLVAGILLVIPGFVSDLVAFVLLIPPLRRGIIRFYLRYHRLDGDLTPHRPPSTGKAEPGRPPLEGESHREE